MNLVDFTIINEKSNFTDNQLDRLYLLQQEHVNGNCHGLTVLLSSFVEGKVKVLSSSDCGVIHSFLEIGKDRYLDGWGICSDVNDIISNYSSMCTDGSISVKDSTKKNIINNYNIDSNDIKRAITFWRMNDRHYNLPTKLKIPKGINKDNALDIDNHATKEPPLHLDM